MTYVLELPDGRCVICRDAAQARRYAELLIILTTGAAPAPSSSA